MRYLLMVLLLVPTYALAQAVGYAEATYITDATLYQRFIDAAPNWLVGLVPILVSILVGARALSEVLLIVAKKTETTADDKLLSYVSKFVGLLGKVLGQIGVGMPNKMVEAKAEKIQEKKND